MRSHAKFYAWGCLLLVACFSAPAFGQSLADQIDQAVEARLQAEGMTPAAPADDYELCRRTTLDLVGRVPTLAEVQAYVASTDPAKREQLVDRLMASQEFVRFQATEFDALLMAGADGSVRDYLLKAFAEAPRWDVILRDMLQPPAPPVTPSPTAFLLRRVNNVDKLANDVSVLFFGVNISCAKCHDHPLVDDWKQDHYYGMVSFFNRSFENGGFVGERQYGLVSYRTVAGEERRARLMFLSGEELEEPAVAEPTDEQLQFEQKRLEELRNQQAAPPSPSFSRREQLLAAAALPRGRDMLARSLVNRMFLRFLGYGLVMPVDQMHSSNPASHPELLDSLSAQVVANGYDLRQLIRGIVLSRTYGRSSSWEASPRPDPSLFAVANVRPLTPPQLGASLLIAARDPEQFGPTVDAASLEQRLLSFQDAGLGWGSRFERPGDGFQVSADEALWFNNSEQAANDLLSEGGDRLVGRLLQLASPEERAATAIWSVFGRPPTPAETAMLVDYQNARADRTAAACQQLVWALLTSSEFRFNH